MKNGRTPPHSIDAEAFLLSCIMLDGQHVMGLCAEAGIEPQHFYLSAHNTVYSRLKQMSGQGKPLEMDSLVQELKSFGELESVGGIPAIVAMSSRVPTTAQAGYFVEKVRELHTLRETITAATRIVEDAHGFTGGLSEFLERSRNLLPEPAISSIPSAKAISSFGYPLKDDPNILLGKDDFLGRGGGLLFISHAGAGKSSWILGACMSWALGRPWMGIAPRGALKSLIIQAEDSDRYMGKVVESFCHIEKLSQLDREQLGKNCIVVRLKGVAGPSFISALRSLVRKHTPDLVVINPLYMYAEGDIGRSEFAQPFLSSLDAVNREEKFAYVLVHHTGKPNRNQKGEHNQVEDWESVYMGFGSSYLANWPRCSILLEPMERKGHYVLKLGKGGLNAGIVQQVPQGAGHRLEPVTRIAIKHSHEKMPVGDDTKPCIYWHLDETEDFRKFEPAKKSPLEFKNYVSVFPSEIDNAQTWQQLHRIATGKLPISQKQWAALCVDWAHEGLIYADLRNPNEPKYYVP